MVTLSGVAPAHGAMTREPAVKSVGYSMPPVDSPWAAALKIVTGSITVMWS
jgi:hypothetical protein